MIKNIDFRSFSEITDTVSVMLTPTVGVKQEIYVNPIQALV